MVGATVAEVPVPARLAPLAESWETALAASWFWKVMTNGPVPVTTALFKPTVTRSAADLDEISAGAGVGYFSLVWNIGAGLAQPLPRRGSLLPPFWQH